MGQMKPTLRLQWFYFCSIRCAVVFSTIVPPTPTQTVIRYSCSSNTRPLLRLMPVQGAWPELATFVGLNSAWALPVGLLPLLVPGWYFLHREEVMVYTEGAPTLLAVAVAAGWAPYPRLFLRFMRWRADIGMYCFILPIIGQVCDAES
jgi:hypothetical protein